MSFIKKVAMSAGQTVAEEIAKQAVKKISKNFTEKVSEPPQKNSSQKIKNNSDDEDFISKTTNFLKQAGKEISASDVASLTDIVGVTTGASMILSPTMFFGKTALDVKGTKDILGGKVEKLCDEGKITQDILDAILCENRKKLEIACDEVFAAEKIGKKLKFLSKDEVDDALSLRKAITKTVIHKVLG